MLDLQPQRQHWVCLHQGVQLQHDTLCARGKQPASCQGQARHSDQTWMTNLTISFCVHAGCRYNYLDPTVNKGWDVAALPDAVSDYQGPFRRCYEIGCAPMHLKVRLAQLGMSQVQ